ncbi:MAG TPA: copper resistance protein CopC [Gemmatimonadaceae bacterium]|nr:copper resistance protein CopC [Gemmatimonadaceae bacterium]
MTNTPKRASVRAFVRAVVLAACCALVLGTGVDPARAAAFMHATLISSEPAADAVLARAPRRVRLVFSEPIEPTLARVSLIAQDGDVQPLAPTGDPTDVHALLAPTDSLAMGAYRVAWRIVSADGHPVQGSFVFFVGGADTASMRAEPPPVPPGALSSGAAPRRPSVAGAPLVPALLRGLALGALAALGGVLLFLAITGAGRASRPTRLATWLAVATPVLLIAHALAWIVHVSPDHALSAASASTALRIAVGRVELWRVGFSLLALWALVLARRPRLALLFAAGALIASGDAGHSAAISPAWMFPSKALHLVGVSAWLGGLLWLLVRERDDLPRFAAEAGRVSAIALAAAIVVAASGVVQALIVLPTPADLFRSAYGAITLAKVAGFGGLIAFGAYHRYRVLPRLTHDGTPLTLRRSVSREVTLMCIVVLLGGLLAYVPPPAAHHSATMHHSATHGSMP